MNSGKNKFGLGSIVLLGLNGIIGAGIYLLPGKAMALVGPASMFVHVFLAVLTLTIALCYAECAAMFGRNGAAYVYAREAFGGFIGFEVGFLKLITRLTSWAALTVALLTALSVYWPGVLHGLPKVVMTLALLGGLAVVNILGVRPTEVLNNTVTVIKLLPLVVIVLFGVFAIEPVHFTPLFPADFSDDKFGAAVLLMFFAYVGIDNMAMAAEDMKNPEQNLPVAIVAVVVLCCIIYFLVQAVAVGTLGPALADSKVPVADVAQVLLGPVGRELVSVGAIISILGITVASSFSLPRLAVALAQDGLLPRRFARNGRYGTPGAAIVLCLAVTVPLAITGSFTQLVAINGVVRFINYLSTCLAVLVMRRREPERARSFRVPYLYGTALIAMALIVWILFNASRFQLLFGAGALLAVVPLYLLMRWQDRDSGGHGDGSLDRKEGTSGRIMP